ncbi:hypothetical protein, partial [Klebsiella pneumoniae]
RDWTEQGTGGQDCSFSRTSGLSWPQVITQGLSQSKVTLQTIPPAEAPECRCSSQVEQFYNVLK